MGLSDARKRTKLDQDFGSGTPTNWYWGLSRTEPNEDGSGVSEPVGAGYARVLKTNNATNFPAAVTAGGRTVKRNGTDVTWPNPTGDWGACGWYVLFQASTGGVPDYWNKLDDTFNPKAGLSPVQIDANTAELQVA
ncbi:hypothetical protein I4I73_03230 [Pseudonocardia sp. KRD-184]|uniref:Uncharacterized protein n=1 Tax=Pseudonocardia oceani TaxID=2792013 RepID=A0ABS6UJX8_9PSEU|nr:hypothetical protein [Pseudonocardia oceani]MBW0088228.1 hypothetical protein [Pseudonocardia oceani]MBW0095009.1 hypothetical protein [Pseudonocardia oceani]MBW0121137.1 hypothetical protein [Pseudonocardia oceani]MBW0131177.1 hypothetical protein [Pseudonocardia oceani]MBW0132561.1 hypothetical protein [Pseudonocardia oceani]